MDYWKNIDYFKKHNKLYRGSKMGKAFDRLYCYKRMDEKNGFGDVIDFDAKWIVENIFSKPCVHCGETDWIKLGCNRLDNTKPHTKDNVEPCCYKCNCKLNGKTYEKKVYQYKLDGELVKVWNSTAECGRNGFNEGHVAACCRGEYGHKTHKGYKWSYEPL